MTCREGVHAVVGDGDSCGIVATARKKNAKVKVTALTPYVVGWPGYGHLYKGDRGSFEVAGDTRREIHVERVMSAKLEWSADHFAQWELEFGPREDEDPMTRLMREIAGLATAASELGLF
ncbi:hypothetical protein SAMN04488548_1103 [Gordonia westfalica]|uniref:Gp28/Gp37-like domain-containing protein n=1 Tax=Gordonia westfalica TaxID=158898 RepID=A0A1H2DP27_9ACTN|nr:hypothetical protein SAMN04488548_1103 [Gordonia westfalica]